MSDIAICAEKLGKRYRLVSRRQETNVRDELAQFLWAPVRAARSIVNGQGMKTDVQKSGGYIWALKDVSFRIKQGEVVGIIGRNGAGKSTLLKLLSRITEPTDGVAAIYGRVGSLLEVGTGFHPELTGRDNIYLSGALLGMKRAEINSKFHEIVAFSEIEMFVDTPVKYYSSGMYMRLAFAVAAHLTSEILLVDEVLAVGDVAFQRKCLGMMDSVARKGRTIVFVSHNMAAIKSLCSRALLLGDGTMLECGATDTVINTYLRDGESSSASCVALPQGEPDAPGYGVALRSLSLEGEARATFRLGEPWRIAIDFEMVKSADAVVAAIGLVSVDSTPIITYWSQSEHLEPGRYRVEFECLIPLARCDLRFNVGLSSRGRAFYYTIECGFVSVAEVAQSEQPFRASGSGMLVSHTRPEIRCMTTKR